ncbi:hypothetical protein ACS0TY_033699 [Phlomoides rotata]
MRMKLDSINKVGFDQDIKTIDDFSYSVIRRRKAKMEQNNDEKVRIWLFLSLVSFCG